MATVRTPLIFRPANKVTPEKKREPELRPDSLFDLAFCQLTFIPILVRVVEQIYGAQEQLSLNVSNAARPGGKIADIWQDRPLLS